MKIEGRNEKEEEMNESESKRIGEREEEEERLQRKQERMGREWAAIQLQPPSSFLLPNLPPITTHTHNTYQAHFRPFAHFLSLPHFFNQPHVIIHMGLSPNQESTHIRPKPI